MINSQRRGGLGLGLLLYQIFGVIGVDRIPPATLTIAGLQIGLYLRLVSITWRHAGDVCMSVYNVWEKREWYRFLFAAFEHADDWHLYYNMVSFIWKGISLERRLGSAKFTYLVLVFTALCNATYLLLCYAASEMLHYKYENYCAVGFSGVIFALKVLTTHYWPSSEHQLLMGFIPMFMPPQYMVWAELLLIQILVPNASFIGHLAGVLVGVAYVKGPLKPVTDYVWQILSTFLFTAPNPRSFRQARTVPLSQSMYEQYVPSGMTEDEQMEYAHYESIQQAHYRNIYTPEDMSESEQLRRATEESLWNNANYHPYPGNMPSAPYADDDGDLPYPSSSGGDLPYPDNRSSSQSPRYPEYPSTSRSNIYPDLDEIRKRRLDRFN